MYFVLNSHHLWEMIPLLVKLRAYTFRPILETYSLWAGRNPYHVMPAVTWSLGYRGLTQRTAQILLPLPTSKGYWGPNLPQIIHEGKNVLSVLFTNWKFIALKVVCHTKFLYYISIVFLIWRMLSISIAWYWLSLIDWL